MIQQNASVSEQMASTSEELASQAEQLQAAIEFFKVDTASGHAAGQGSRVMKLQTKAAPRSECHDGARLITHKVAHANGYARKLKREQKPHKVAALADGTTGCALELGEHAGEGDARDAEFERY